MLWSDPCPENGRKSSPRGAGLLFGPDVTKEFLSLNKLNLLVRSHECMEAGYKSHHSNSCITIFSASNYCGTVGNDGAILIFQRDEKSNQLKRNVLSYYGKMKFHSFYIHFCWIQATNIVTNINSTMESARSKYNAFRQEKLHLSSFYYFYFCLRICMNMNILFMFVFCIFVCLDLFICCCCLAGPKEKQSRYQFLDGVLVNDVISRLLLRISEQRLALIHYFGSIQKKHSDGIATVTR
jgi:hypothetical protein